MELTLKLLTGRNAGQEIPIPSSKFLIGRADDCHLRPHSDTVSRHHCVILVEEGFCAVRDFGSRNGTLVNEQKVVGQHELHNGDRLKVGNLDFEVQLTSRVGGKKRPKVKDVKDAAQRTAAGTTGSKGDNDISDWLTAGEGDAAAADDLRETRQPPHETPAERMSARETAFLQTPTNETTTVKPLDAKTKETVVGEPKVTESGPMKALKQKSKFVTPSQTPKDSREAASMALRKLFNNRNG